jgi:biotin carboxyl carrier protein
MKIKVNGTEYDVEIFGNKSIINNQEIKIEIKDDTIIIGNKVFYLDFYEEDEGESLLIINGMAFVASKKSMDDQIIKEIKAPISGEIVDILIQNKSNIEKGQGLVILEAMKMFNEIKSPVKGTIKDIRVNKNQSVNAGEIIMLLE